MQKNIIGNLFQNHMWIKFNQDLYSTSAIMSKVRGNEDLVYEYINEMGLYIQNIMKIDIDRNPYDLYADYITFQNEFVGYWRRALNIPRTEMQELKDIFDEVVISQDRCRNLNATVVFFENGNAIAVDACLKAVYDVLTLEWDN